jgi:hypothetical protein
MEMAELPKLLIPGEKVLGVISGFSHGNTVLLAVTSDRLLVVDKKWVRLSYEDIRYESINEVTYSQQGFLAGTKFYVMGRDFVFKSWYRKELRMLVQFVQDKMFELRPSTKTDTKKYGFRNHKQNQSLEPIMQAPEFKPEDRTSEDMTQVISVMKKESEKITEIPKHITDRVARWQRAARFVGGLPEA